VFRVPRSQKLVGIKLFGVLAEDTDRKEKLISRRTGAVCSGRRQLGSHGHREKQEENQNQ
jgi:hypothetical protein